MVIRKAACQLEISERERITGIVFFGDPSKLGKKLPSDLKDRVLNLRLPFDFVNFPIPVLTITHFCYPLVSFGDAIQFIRGKISG
jgi:hypothetical protein